MSVIFSCSQCGTPFPQERDNGICPVCALQAVLGGGEAPPAARTAGLRSFGDYELIEEIARGGMGVVYKARQVSLGRIVAIKMLIFGAQARPEDIRRFRLEASAAAGLQHPGIVSIHEVGVQEGQQYLVMDYVEGPTLAELAADHPLPAMQAAAYLGAIARAIHHAHEHGILHRDLKPSNVLIDQSDQPRVTDFGLAKRITDSQLMAPDPQLTLSGQVIGSPNYMAPEQALAKPGRLSRATDVYALGAMLYHLITGRPPLGGDGLAETLQQVLHQEPAPPRLLNPGVPRDLETICLKCLEKEPRRRYQTAQLLAEELDRFMRREPIHARRANAAEHAWRWCQRRPATAGLAALTAVSLLVVLVGSPIAALRISRARVAEQAAREQAEVRAYTADMNIVLQAWQEGDLERAQALLSAHIPKPGRQDLRDFEWRYLWNLCQDESKYSLTNQPGEGTAFLCASPKSSYVLTGTTHMVRLLDATSGHEVDRFVEPDPARRICAADAACQQPTIVATGDTSGGVSLWDIRSKTIMAAFKAHSGRVAVLALSPDGKLMASSDGGDGDRGTFKLWDVASLEKGKRVPKWEKRLAPRLLRFSPDNRTLLSDGQPYANGVLRAWDAVTGNELPPIPANLNGHVETIAFSSDGKLLADSGVQNRIFIWDFPQRRLLTVLTNQVTHLGPVAALAFSWDDRRLVSGGYDNTVRIWDFDTQTQTVLRGHRTGLRAVAFAPNNHLVFSTSGDEIKMWSTEGRQLAAVLDTHQTMRGVAVSPDFHWLITNKYHEETHPNPKVWNLQTRSWQSDLEGPGQDALGRCFTKDGRIFALGYNDLKIRFWDTSLWPAATNTVAPFAVVSNQFEPGELLFLPDGKTLVVTGQQIDRVTPTHFRNRLAFWDTQSLTRLRLLEAAGASDSEAAAAETMAISSNGQTLAIGYEDGWVRLWSFPHERQISSFHDFANGVGYGIGLCFSNDGHWLAESVLGKIVLYDLSDLEHVRRSAAWDCRHRGTMWATCFAPGDKTLVTSGNDGRIKFWNLATREVALTLVHGNGPFACLAFSDDGNTLFSSDGNGIVKLWPATPVGSLPQNQP